MDGDGWRDVCVSKLKWLLLQLVKVREGWARWRPPADYKKGHNVITERFRREGGGIDKKVGEKGRVLLMQ